MRDVKLGSIKKISAEWLKQFGCFSSENSRFPRKISFPSKNSYQSRTKTKACE